MGNGGVDYENGPASPRIQSRMLYNVTELFGMAAARWRVLRRCFGTGGMLF
jgi:hypothetical protein